VGWAARCALISVILFFARAYCPTPLVHWGDAAIRHENWPQEKTVSGSVILSERLIKKTSMNSEKVISIDEIGVGAESILLKGAYGHRICCAGDHWPYDTGAILLCDLCARIISLESVGRDYWAAEAFHVYPKMIVKLHHIKSGAFAAIQVGDDIRCFIANLFRHWIFERGNDWTNPSPISLNSSIFSFIQGATENPPLGYSDPDSGSGEEGDSDSGPSRPIGRPIIASSLIVFGFLCLGIGFCKVCNYSPPRWRFVLVILVGYVAVAQGTYLLLS